MGSSRLVFGRKLRKGLFFFGECDFYLPVENMKYVLEATAEHHHYIVRCGLKHSASVVSLINRAVNFGTEVDQEGNIHDIWYKPDANHVGYTRYTGKPTNYFGVDKDEYTRVQTFFQKISKYVQKDSYILGHTEERYWRWLFNGDCLIPQTGELIFRNEK